MAQVRGISFTCPVCGANDLRADADDDGSMARCGACGAEFGRWGEVKANLGLPPDAGKASAEKPKFKGLNQSWKL